MKSAFPLLSLGLLLVSATLHAQNASSSNNAGLRAEREKLQRLEREYNNRKRVFQADRNNAAKRKAFVDATVRYGSAVMMSPALRPNEKYPRALRLYREALRLDPRNKEALTNKRMIEDIYRSMGRPIPT